MKQFSYELLLTNLKKFFSKYFFFTQIILASFDQQWCNLHQVTSKVEFFLSFLKMWIDALHNYGQRKFQNNLTPLKDFSSKSHVDQKNILNYTLNIDFQNILLVVYKQKVRVRLMWNILKHFLKHLKILEKERGRRRSYCLENVDDGFGLELGIEWA